jgi:hypothetical protein
VTPPLELWLQAYALTLAIEVPIAVGLLWRRVPIREAAACALLATTLTHPALWYLAPRFEPYATWVLVMEVLVFSVEAAVWTSWLQRHHTTPLPRWTGAGVSFVSNLASAAFGWWWMG